MKTCKYFFITILFFTLAFSKENIKYYNANQFLLEGTSLKSIEKENYYDRLPAIYKEKVREPVWQLSKNSAGISVRFKTNSSQISVHWELLNDFHMSHMAGTGIRGLDLYCKVENGWQYVKTAIPQKKASERLLIKNMSKEMREYKLYLPLYDGLANLEIGIDSLAQIASVKKSDNRSIVFYGTSITQGGCASRPGMAYTNIISRKLDYDCINLGFSGNGRMEKEIAEFISTIDAEFIVIDCLPNMKSEDVKNNLSELVNTIRTNRNEVPIVFVENIIFETSHFDQEEFNILKEKNLTLKEEVAKLNKQGIKKLYYIDSKNLSRNDHEGTVDGVHLTDLGFTHIAEVFINRFQEFKLIEK